MKPATYKQADMIMIIGTMSYDQSDLKTWPQGQTPGVL